MSTRSTVLEPGLASAPPKPRGSVNVVPMKSRGVVTQPEDRHRSRRPDRPFLLEHDILRVENVDDVTWEFRWDRKRYPIKPGEVGFVPFPGVVMKLGDPRSMENEMVRYNTDDGQRGVVLTRYEELCRLFAHYGIEQENVDELVDFAPKVVVETMTGESVIFPVQDPQMVAFPVPNAPQPGKENTDTRRLMDKMSAENDEMRAEVAELRSLIAAKLGGSDAGSSNDDRDLIAASLVGGGATADTGPQTRI